MSQRTEDAARFREIMDEILELTEEAYRIAREHGQDAVAKSYWVPHIRGAVDSDNSGFLGGSMMDMADTLDALRDERCDGCGERFGGEIEPAFDDGTTLLCLPCARYNGEVAS